MVLPFSRLRHPRTWAIAPGLEDVPLEGRDRFDMTGYDLPEVTLEESPVELRVTAHDIRLTISLMDSAANGKSDLTMNGRSLRQIVRLRLITSDGGTTACITT